MYVICAKLYINSKIQQYNVLYKLKLILKIGIYLKTAPSKCWYNLKKSYFLQIKNSDLI